MSKGHQSGLFVGIAFAAIFGLLALIFAAVHFARWRARRRALKESAALEANSKPVEDDPDGLVDVTVCGAESRVVVDSVDGVDGGVSEKEQIQAQAIAMPYGVPTYPMPTPHPFVDPASSEPKEYVNEKADAEELSYLPIYSRSTTPAEGTPTVPYTSPPSSILPNDNTVINKNDHSTTTTANSHESFPVPFVAVGIPPSSKQ